MIDKSETCWYKGQVGPDQKPNGVGLAIDPNGCILEGFFTNGELAPQPFIRFNDNGWTYGELCNTHGDNFQIRFYRSKFDMAQRHAKENGKPKFYYNKKEFINDFNY